MFFLYVFGYGLIKKWCENYAEKYVCNIQVIFGKI